MCGLIGIVGQSDVAASLYDGLLVLQHRGQDAAGIATVNGSRVNLLKGLGFVRDVFLGSAVERLEGATGIGHCRYPTAGSENVAEAQPFYVNSPFGITLAHNGNLTNALELKRELFATDRRHINTDSDSEVLLNVFAHELEALRGTPLGPELLFRAIAAVHRRCLGGYAVIAHVLGFGLVAFRDPNGIRPLMLGQRLGPNGIEYALASESVALDVLGFKRIGDVAPGEAVLISEKRELRRQQTAEAKLHAPCIFEYVYLARPDTLMEDVSVYKARARMGEKLAQKILRLRPDHDIDKVIPIPDTSRTAALTLAQSLGVDYREGFVKNRYVGRTFIMPGQAERVKSVRRKLNAIELEFRNRNVLLVDDSIVRGTTSRQIIQMARDAGARKVYFASAAPPVRYPNVYGIDMPAVKELVAHGRSEAEIESLLGCDWLIYQDLPDLIAAVSEGNPKLKQFDTSCFDGQYITGLSGDYLRLVEQARSDEAKALLRAPRPKVARAL
jgi:amidophosphoribosyltransferase